MHRGLFYLAILLLDAAVVSAEPAHLPAPRDAVAAEKRSLKQVLDYLSTASGQNIVATDVELQKLKVALPESTQSWRAMLETLCRQHGLRLDESRKAEKVLYVWKPKTITYTFNKADIRDVLWAIATDANISIVIDPEVKGEVTAHLKDVPWDTALESIVKSLGFEIVREKGQMLRVK